MKEIYRNELQKTFKDNLPTSLAKCVKLLEKSGLQVRGYYSIGTPVECVLEVGTTDKENEFNQVLTLRADLNTELPTTWSVTVGS